MSERLTVVHDSDTDEVKIFAGDKQIGRYKTLLDAVGQLATFVPDLTAAQQRITELEKLLFRSSVIVRDSLSLDGFRPSLSVQERIRLSNDIQRSLAK